MTIDAQIQRKWSLAEVEASPVFFKPIVKQPMSFWVGHDATVVSKQEYLCYLGLSLKTSQAKESTVSSVVQTDGMNEECFSDQQSKHNAEELGLGPARSLI